MKLSKCNEDTQRPHLVHNKISLSLSLDSLIAITIPRVEYIKYIYKIYLYNAYINQEQAIMMSNNVNTLLKTHSPRFVDQVYIGQTMRKAISLFLYVMDVLTKCHSLSRSQYQTLSSTWAPMYDLLGSNHSNL